MKTIDHALELRGRIFGAFELAEHEDDPVARCRLLTFVVVGAGPAGVELAGQLAELSRRSLQRNLRRIDPAGVAQVAIQSGRHAARTIIGRISGESTPRPFQYHDRGTMATISRFRALAVVGRIQLAGFSAWLAWLAVHLVTLTGFKNRVAALFNWAIAFLGRGRPQRVITIQQVFARRALEKHPHLIPSTRTGGVESSLGI